MGKRNHVEPSVCAEAASICACFHFRRASRAVTQLFDATLAESGLRSTQFVILVMIHADEGPILLPDLADALHVDRSTLTRNLQPLARSGFVRIARSRDARASCVRLTAKGQRVLARTVPLWEEAQGRFVDALGARRWRTMLRDLDDVVDAAHEA